MNFHLLSRTEHALSLSLELMASCLEDTAHWLRTQRALLAPSGRQSNRNGCLVDLALGGEARAFKGPGLLSVRHGSVWLTQDGELEDHVLVAGAFRTMQPGARWHASRWCPTTAAQIHWLPGAARAAPRRRAAHN